ncbi:MAG: hypothetical protein ACXVCH_17405, partial [Bdellovibrionota bacterium]
PTDVVQLVVRRIGELDLQTKVVLSHCAVLGSRFELDLLPSLMGLGAEEIDFSLSRALSATLIERGEAGQYSFVHDRVQEAFLAWLSPEKVQAMHQKIADAMTSGGETKGASDPADFAYRLARHRIAGTPERAPDSAIEACTDAGGFATRNFATEDAYQFFQNAYEICERHSKEKSYRLLEALGYAALSCNRLPEALKYLGEALGKAPDSVRRARLLGRIARIHVANLRGLEAEKYLLQAFAEIRYPAPAMTVKDFAMAIKDWAIGIAMSRFRIGLGTAKGEHRERLIVLAQLYEFSVTVNYFNFKLPLAIQAAFRQMRYALRLGPGRELAYFYGFYGMIVWSVFKKRAIGEQCMKKARQIAEKSGDPLLISHVIAYNATCTSLAGAEREAEPLLIHALEEQGRWLSTEDFTNTAGPLLWTLISRGFAAETLKWAHFGTQKLESLGGPAGESQNQFRYVWKYSFACSSLALLGRHAEAAEALRNFQKHGNNVPYFMGIHYFNEIVFYTETGEFGEPLDKAIAGFKSFGPGPLNTPVHLRNFFVIQSYARLLAAMRATPETRAKRLADFRSAQAELKRMKMTPLHAAYWNVFHAAWLRLEGDLPGAQLQLNLAEELARDVNSPLAEFEIARQRALLLNELKNRPSAVREARAAYQIAADQGWNHRAKQMAQEFSFSHGGSSSSTTRVDSGSTISSGMALATGALQRQVDALLQLSLASASVLNPEQQARVALDEIVRLLSAERAFLFLVPDSGHGLIMKAGR